MRVTPTSIVLTLRRHCGVEAEITWREITQITAYKQDLFNPQIVVLEIHAGSAVWEIDAADFGGFEIFSHIFAQHLAGLQPFATWWPLVIDPLGHQEGLDLYVRTKG